MRPRSLRPDTLRPGPVGSDLTPGYPFQGPPSRRGKGEQTDLRENTSSPPSRREKGEQTDSREKSSSPPSLVGKGDPGKGTPGLGLVPWHFGHFPTVESARRRGLVSLVGAGPGDPDLLTVKAVRRLSEADAVVYDRLVSAEVLAYAPADAARYDVGKGPRRSSYPQDEINALLVRLGRGGERVVRLKGGDPFVFGRGGEEVLALREAGVPWEVIPGVSSALAAPAAAGIPVTHRGVAASVTIATGHARAEAAELEHDWDALARQRGTLVFLMAVENLDVIAANLLDHGRDPDEPTAIVEAATTPSQRVVRASLRDVVSTARAAEIQPPAILVVGETTRVLNGPRADRSEIDALAALVLR